MNRKFIFRDTDISGFEEYDISDIDYEELILTCSKYCFSFSLRTTYPNAFFPNGLEKFKIPLNYEVEKVYSHYYAIFTNSPSKSNVFTYLDGIDINKYVTHYKITEESIKLIFKISKSLFTMGCTPEHNRPEDITFFRRDKSVFLKSITHDGICELTPRSNEDVSDIVAKPNWIRILC